MRQVPTPRSAARGARPPFTVWLGLVPLLATVLVACGAPALDAELAEVAVLLGVEEAFADAASLDGVDLGGDLGGADVGELGVADVGVGPRTVVRRVDMQRSVEVASVSIDLDAEPATATVDATLVVTGTAEIWALHPEPEATRTLLGTKPIDLRGEVRFELERRRGAWWVVDVRRAPLTQGSDAPGVGPWRSLPDPWIAGAPAVVRVDVDAPVAEDEVRVHVVSRALVQVQALRDGGQGVDEVAGDGVYSGVVDVRRATRPAERLVLFGALNHTATTDLAVDDDGAYVRPYTETLLPSWVVVRTLE